jgi:hypothetical protein
MEEEIKLTRKKIRKRTRKEIIIFFFANLFFLVLLMIFALWWQGKVDLFSFADGIWLVFSFQLTLSWSLFVYNENIFTPLVHGVKTFFLIFVGRKPNEDYFTYYTKIRDNPIPTAYVMIGFIFTLMVLIVGVVLNLLVYP